MQKLILLIMLLGCLLGALSITSFSASAYLYEMQTSENTALANLTKALYAFATSAKDYAA